MKSFMLFASLVVLVHGRAQYDYPRPFGSKGSPSVGHFGDMNSDSSFSNIRMNNNGHGIRNGYSYDSGIGGYTSKPNNNERYSPVSTGNGVYVVKSQDKGYIDGGTTIVHKHFFAHAPPPDRDEYPQRRLVIPPSMKHYKILVIKVPSAAAPKAPVLAPLVTKEEKTFVYLLLKNQGKAPEVTIPTAAPTSPSKPEVYFIRYKGKKELAGNRQNFNNGGLVASYVNDRSFSGRSSNSKYGPSKHNGHY